MRINYKSEKGQAIVLIAFAIVAVMGMIGLAMDGGQVFSDRRHAQNSVDTAAYAAALSYLNHDAAGVPETKAVARLNSNSYSTSNTQSITVTSTDLPVDSTSPYKCTLGSGKLFVVSMTTNVNSWFAGLFGIQQFHNSVTSTSRACATSGSDQYSSKNSILTCNTDSCGNGANAGNIVKADNGNALYLKGGGLFSNSTDSNCVNLHNGNIFLDENSTTPPACAIIGSVSPSFRYYNGVTTASTPPCSTAFLPNQAPRTCPADLQGITCGPQNPAPIGGVAQPGTYGSFPPSSSTLAPGLYCVTGQWKMSGQSSVTGTGVTIYMQTSGIKWSGSNITVDIKAAKSSDYPNCLLGGTGTGCPAGGAVPGLLLYAPSTNNSGMTMTGGTIHFQGTVLATAWHCDYAGGTSLGSPPSYEKVQFICYNWADNGSGNQYIEYDADYFLNMPNANYIGLIK